MFLFLAGGGRILGPCLVLGRLASAARGTRCRRLFATRRTRGAAAGRLGRGLGRLDRACGFVLGCRHGVRQALGQGFHDGIGLAKFRLLLPDLGDRFEAGLFALASRWRHWLATVLAAVVSMDAALTVIEAVSFNAPRASSLRDWAVIAAATLAPAAAAALLWRGRAHRSRHVKLVSARAASTTR